MSHCRHGNLFIQALLNKNQVVPGCKILTTVQLETALGSCLSFKPVSSRGDDF